MNGWFRGKASLVIASFAGCCAVLGCSSASTGAGSTAASAGAAPMVVTVSDAPLGNILSAKVTIAGITLGQGSSGSSASVLAQPETVELSGLGALQEPIEITNLAFGTYSSVTLNISAAQVTYINSSGQVTTASASIAQPAVTVALNPALAVSSQGEVQLQLAFNLAQSFSITGSTVTFNPAMNTSGAQVSSENSGDRHVEVTGAVVAVSSSAITVASGDSSRQFSFSVNSSTQFPSGVTIASIQPASIVQVQGQTQTDGTILAQMITPESQGDSSGQQQDGAKGIIVSVAQDSTGAVTAFTMVPREGFGAVGATTSISVDVSSATTFDLPEDAQQTGLSSTSFNAAELFPGQSVLVTGSGGSTGALQAQKIVLAAESIPASLVAAPVGSSLDYHFTLALPGTAFLTTYSKITSLATVAGQSTDYSGSLTAASFASLAAGASIEVHGFLLVDTKGGYTLYATEIAKVETPENPESGNSTGDN